MFYVGAVAPQAFCECFADEVMVMEQNESAKEKRGLAEQFERIWGQALVAVSAAEEEAHKVVQRIADVAGWSQEEVLHRGRELTERLASQRKDIERGLEEGVRRTLSHLKVPRRDDLQAVRSRLEALAQRVESLTDRATGKSQ